MAYYCYQATSRGGTYKFTIYTTTGAHSYTLSSSSDTDTKSGQYVETITAPSSTTISISGSGDNGWVKTAFVWGVGIKS